MKEYRSISDTEVEVRLSVTPSERGLRLDRFIQQQIPRLSRQRVQNIIERGVVDQDGKATKPSRIVKVGDVYVWHREVEADTGEIPEVGILFESDDLLVVDKPANVVVHPTAKVFKATVTSWLNVHRPDAKIAHRLDRETSGAFVCGKHGFCRYLKAQFRDGTVKKTYLAIVRGSPKFDAHVCDLPLLLDDESTLGVKMRVDEANGMASRTRMRVVQRMGDLSLVECKPETGRQHQIRVHLWALGHPILGDKLYGVEDAIFREAADHGLTERVLLATGAPRHLLHAKEVAIPLPSGEVQIVEAPLPQDFVDRIASWVETPSHTDLLG